VDAALDVSLLRRFQHELARKGARPRTIRGAFHALRGLSVFLVNTGYLGSDPTQNITLPEKDGAIRLLVSDEEVAALLRATENQLDEHRAAFSKALLSTLVYAGLRASECVNLKLEHVNLDAQTILVDNGKGQKTCQLYPPYEFFVALRAWLKMRSKMGCTHAFIFAQDKRRPISDEWLRRHVDEIAAMAGMKGASNIKPHSLRHWFATHMEEQGATPQQIMAALRHAHLQTTVLYLHGEEADAKAMPRFASFDPNAYGTPFAAGGDATARPPQPDSKRFAWPSDAQRAAEAQPRTHSRSRVAQQARLERGRFGAG
jgi:integrase/recombinase XerC